MGGRVARDIAGITARQRSALERLSAVLPQSAYLAGGVAVAIRCGHRSSIDLDIFMPEDPVPVTLPAIKQMEGVLITQQASRTLYVEIDGIPTSILAYEYAHLAPPEAITGVSVPVASVADLVAMKLAAIGDRGAARDFWDLHELMLRTSMSLDAALELHQRRFPRLDPGHIVRALVYFADADAAPLPRSMSAETWEAIKHDFRDWVRAYARA